MEDEEQQPTKRKASGGLPPPPPPPKRQVTKASPKPKAKVPEVPLPSAVAKKASPEASRQGGAIARGDSWKEFQDTDPLYALLGELGQRKGVYAGGALDEEALLRYIQRCMTPGVITKPKNWIEVWAAMNIPIESQVDVIQRIIEVGLGSEVADTVPDVLAELVKGHRVKTKAVEEAMITLFECGSDEQSCISRFLLLIFPKSPSSEWGWSRVGWNWQQWWTGTERILNTLEETSAFMVLCELLRSIESESGAYLPHQQMWDEKRLALVRGALCRLGGMLEDELDAATDIVLS